MNDGLVKKLSIALFVVVLILGSFWWANRGYGTVSPQTYEFSKAIYGACLARSEQRLDKIEEMLAEPANDAIPAHERKWLEAIISNARAENWKTASEKARSMMEEQTRSSS